MVEVGEINTIVLTYKLNDTQFKQLNSSSNFVFLSRTIVNENLGEYWPQQDETHNHAYRFETTANIYPHLKSSPSSDEITSALVGNSFRIGTLDEVLDRNNWK